MISILLKLFIPNYEDMKNPKIREQYATVASGISILCNVMLCVLKLIAGTLTQSISIQADAFNNLSDAGSNVATLLGFQLANRRPDSSHPYGHGRYEYIMGLIIAFLIFAVSFSTLKESILKIVEPQVITFNIVSIMILISSLVVKIGMAYLNNDFSKRIHSPSLKAAATDSLNDCISTSATLFSVLFAYFNGMSIDGWVGVFVSVFVFKAGIDVFNDTVNPLLGQAPDPQLLKDIEAFVLGYSRVIGVHDFVIHDYGASRLFVTLHAEVRADEDILEAHDMIDEIERQLSQQFNCLTTIHMDPIDMSDEKTNQLRQLVLDLVVDLNPAYTIHDFRLVSGKTHTNLIFDIVLPANDHSDEQAIKEYIDRKVKLIDSTYYTVIEIDHSYIG